MIKTVSLETAKSLKKAKFKQNNIGIYWLTTMSHKYILNQEIPGSEDEVSFITFHDDHRRWTMEDKFNNFAAPTTDEILEELPKEVMAKNNKWELEIIKNKDSYGCAYQAITTREYSHFLKKKGYEYLWDFLYACCERELCESLAQMWLYLKKENLI